MTEWELQFLEPLAPGERVGFAEVPMSDRPLPTPPGGLKSKKPAAKPVPVATGVELMPTKMYRATVSRGGCSKILGSFATKDEAIWARGLCLEYLGRPAPPVTEQVPKALRAREIDEMVRSRLVLLGWLEVDPGPGG